MEYRRASAEQFSTMLDFMERHGDLAKPQPGAQGRLRSDRLWLELANMLNSIGGGVERSPDKWKRDPQPSTSAGHTSSIGNDDDLITVQESSPVAPIQLASLAQEAAALSPPPSQRPPSPDSTPRRRQVRLRRRRALAPFDRAASEFTAIEKRRLELDERREETELQRLKIEEMRARTEARRVEVDHEHVAVLNCFADIAQTYVELYRRKLDEQ